MIEKEIELFRVGGTASRGITPEILAEVATQDCEANPAAICFGHPKSDTPAAGIVKKLRAVGNSLFGTVKLNDVAQTGVAKDEWINRSAAFFDPTHEANPRPGKWSFRHLGLLGAAAPGIPGMGTLQKALAFDAASDELTVDGDPADAVIFSGAPTPVHYVFDSKEPTVMADKTPEQLAADFAERERLQTERENAFAARLKSERETANAAIVAGLVTAGKVLPAEVKDLETVFNALGGDELTFSADRKGSGPAELGAFLAKALSKRLPVDEQRRSPSREFDATGASAKTPGQLTADARALMKADASLTFEAAIELVSDGGKVD
jgi:hypothetical protein